jgi:hypothetical protein
MAKQMIWTTQDIPDQTGKTILVTGANAGLGFESSRVMAGKGAQVIMACRNMDYGREAEARILSQHPEAKLDLRHIDLTDYVGIKQVAQDIREDYAQLDILMNNAGMNRFMRGETSEGFELTLASNHLGHFALTRHLFPLLQASAPSRVVTTSSTAHLKASIDFDDLMLNESYSMMIAYGQSKLANLMFAKELQRRIDSADLNMLSIAVHPGLIRTNMMYRFGSRSNLYRRLLDLLAGPMTESAEVGVRTQLYAASAQDVEGGGYYNPNTEGTPEIGYSTSLANDPEIAARLWQVTEDLLDLKFDL